MADTTTSQSTDFSYWITLYKTYSYVFRPQHLAIFKGTCKQKGHKELTYKIFFCKW